MNSNSMVIYYLLTLLLKVVLNISISSRKKIVQRSCAHHLYMIIKKGKTQLLVLILNIVIYLMEKLS